MGCEDKQTCYYYDAGTNHCRCYDNEALDKLLAENARLQEEMRDLEAYDQVLRDNLNQDHELRRIAESDNAKLRELAENLLMGFIYLETPKEQQRCIDRALDLRRELDVLPMEYFDAHEPGIEVDK
jgi:hypothetical protein